MVFDNMTQIRYVVDVTKRMEAKHPLIPKNASFEVASILLKDLGHYGLKTERISDFKEEYHLKKQLSDNVVGLVVFSMYSLPEEPKYLISVCVEDSEFFDDAWFPSIVPAFERKRIERLSRDYGMEVVGE